MEHTEEYVKLENVSKIYGSKEVKIIAVDEISFRIKKGEFVVVVGPSGAGKTTVLNILGGMDKATSGNVWIDGKNIAKYTDRQLTGYDHQRRYDRRFENGRRQRFDPDDTAGLLSADVCRSRKSKTGGMPNLRFPGCFRCRYQRRIRTGKNGCPGTRLPQYQQEGYGMERPHAGAYRRSGDI